MSATARSISIGETHEALSSIVSATRDIVRRRLRKSSKRSGLTAFSRRTRWYRAKLKLPLTAKERSLRIISRTSASVASMPSRLATAIPASVSQARRLTSLVLRRQSRLRPRPRMSSATVANSDAFTASPASEPAVPPERSSRSRVVNRSSKQNAAEITTANAPQTHLLRISLLN